MLNFWGSKKYKKVINSSTKCLISVKISIMTPHIIPLPLVNVWLIFDLQKYVNWLCVFSKVNPFFQKAQVFCMDLQPAADPYNVVCSLNLSSLTLCNQDSCVISDWFSISDSLSQKIPAFSAAWTSWSYVIRSGKSKTRHMLHKTIKKKKIQKSIWNCYVFLYFFSIFY